jgi:hypothetical protein
MAASPGPCVVFVPVRVLPPESVKYHGEATPTTGVGPIGITAGRLAPWRNGIGTNPPLPKLGEHYQ